MPVWWWTFIYMMFVSAVGMMFFKSKQQSAVTLNSQNSVDIFDNKSIGIFFAILSFALLAFFVGERSSMFDTDDYYYAYNNYYSGDLSQISDIINGNSETKGKGFSILLILFKHFSGGARCTYWFLFLAIIECLSVALFLYRNSVNYFLSIYLFFSSSCFIWLVNGFRQFLAVSIVLFFSNWIKERKTIHFLIIVIIAYYIHSSSILWIPVYFLIIYKPWSVKFIIFSIIFSVVLFLTSSSSLLNDTEYSYLAAGEFNSGVNPFRILFMSAPAVLCFIKRKEIKNKNDKFANMCVNLSVITAEIYIVSMFSSVIVGRIPIYFQMFNYLLLPWIFEKVLKTSERKMIVLVFCLIYFIYFIYDMYFAGNGIYHSSNLQLYYDEV